MRSLRGEPPRELHASGNEISSASATPGGDPAQAVVATAGRVPGAQPKPAPNLMTCGPQAALTALLEETLGDVFARVFGDRARVRLEARFTSDPYRDEGSVLVRWRFRRDGPRDVEPGLGIVHAGGHTKDQSQPEYQDQGSERGK